MNKARYLGTSLVLVNFAAFFHDQLSGHWPADHREWIVLLFGSIVSVGTAFGLYHVTPNPAPPAAQAETAGASLPVKPATIAAVVGLFVACLTMTGCAFDPSKAPQVNFTKWQHQTNVGPFSENATVTNQTVTLTPSGALEVKQGGYDGQISYLGWGRHDTIESLDFVIPPSKVKAAPPPAPVPAPEAPAAK